MPDDICANGEAKCEKKSRALAYICCNFGLRLDCVNSPEITFALTCKLQEFCQKNTACVNTDDIFRPNSCKFEKFVVILQRKMCAQTKYGQHTFI